MKFWHLFPLFLALFSCITPDRQPSGVQLSITSQFLNEMDRISDLQFLNTINESTCLEHLEHLHPQLRKFQSELNEIKVDESEWSLANAKSAFFGKTLGPKVKGWPLQCVQLLRTSITNLRSIMEYLGEPYLEKTKGGFSAQFGSQASLEDVEFKTGDVLLTRGTTFLSATISQISNNPHHYSHIAYVYVDPKTQNVFTLESYPSKGARMYPIAEALKNDNARILLLRPNDSAKAAMAVEYMAAKIQKGMRTKKIIPYDYLYNEKDLSRLSCTEVVQEAYQQKLQISLPLYKSRIENKNSKFLKKVGVTAGNFFVPADLETDPHFTFVFEWVDYSKVTDQRMKDIVVRKMFTWISEDQYVLQGTIKSLFSRGLLKFRRSPYLWDLLRPALGVDNIPMEIPGTILTEMVKLNDVGGLLMSVLMEKETEMQKIQNRHLTNSEIEQILENYRQSDRESYLRRGPAPLHLLFRPYSLVPTVNLKSKPQ